MPTSRDDPGISVKAVRPAHEPDALAEHDEDAAVARVAATTAGPERTNTASSDDTRRQKRSSILKRPGAAPSGKRASINMGELEPRENLAKGVRPTQSASTSDSGGLNLPLDGGDSSTSVGSYEKKKRQTMDLGFLGGRKSRADQFTDQDASARSEPPARKRTAGSMGLGFFRSRSQQNSAADWSESETEGAPPSRKSSGSHASHHRTRSATSVASSAAASAASRGSLGGVSRISTCPQIPPAVTDWIKHRLINTRVWNGFTILFTVVLLFGTQIQDLWCPKSSDLAFDVLFTCSFVFLIVDVLLRSVADPSYFLFTVGKRDFRSSDGEPAYTRSDALCGLHNCFQIGSFMFWCDLLSTLSLLWDISYIGGLRNSTILVGIGIDVLGVPVSFLSVLVVAPQRFFPHLPFHFLASYIHTAGRGHRYIQ